MFLVSCHPKAGEAHRGLGSAVSSVEVASVECTQRRTRSPHVDLFFSRPNKFGSPFLCRGLRKRILCPSGRKHSNFLCGGCGTVMKESSPPAETQEWSYWIAIPTPVIFAQPQKLVGTSCRKS